MAGSEPMLEPAQLIRIIRGFLGHNSEDETLPEFEPAGLLLWDLTADPDSAAQMLDCNLVPAILANVDACIAGAVPEHSKVAIGRVLEICFGMLANILSFQQTMIHIPVEAVMAAVAFLLPTCEDPPALAEMFRTLTAALASGAAGTALQRLQQHRWMLPFLLMVVQNTLQSQLLQRSLQLLAALLAADAATNSDCQLIKQLLQEGLMDAVATVLVPAASFAPEQLLAAQDLETTGTAVREGTVSEPVVQAPTAAGGWDSNDDEQQQSNAADAPVQAGGSSSQDVARLYRSPHVLMELLGVLEQLGSQPGTAAEAMRHSPQLPALLLQLLVASTAAGQQDVLERLLPVLAMLGGSIVPLLQQQQQQQQDDEQAMGGSTQQPEAGDDLQDRIQLLQQLSGLYYMACIAQVLQDCGTGPESLDALDAGWYLVAAGTKYLSQHLQSHMAQLLAPAELKLLGAADDAQQQQHQRNMQQLQQVDHTGQQQLQVAEQQQQQGDGPIQQHHAQHIENVQHSTQQQAQPLRPEQQTSGYVQGTQHYRASQRQQATFLYKQQLSQCRACFKLLEQLCGSLTRARVPVSSVRYCQQFVVHVQQALSEAQLMLNEQQAGTGAGTGGSGSSSSGGMVSAVPSVQQMQGILSMIRSCSHHVVDIQKCCITDDGHSV